jgi:arylsulfatase A-like enzyme
MNNLYDGEVAFADYCIGQILKSLKKLDLIENTIVVITSDHGENLGEHGLIDHLLSMHETTLHIPLLIHYPTKLARGKQNNELVSLVDIAPTILKLCGINADQQIWKPSGSSLIGKDPKHRAFIVAENERPINGLNIMKNKFPSFDTSKIDFPMRALRTKGFKLIWEVGIGKILFNLEADPKENINVIDNFPEVSENLHKILLKWMSKITSIQDTAFLESQDEESLKVLRSLGYIE